jgi:hypothetical protein
MPEEKRPRGRPRKNLKNDEVKRPRGRPRKDAEVEEPKERKYNPISRNNLQQYKIPSEKRKQNNILKKMVDEFEMDVPPEMLEVIIPTKKVFDKEERTRFLYLLHYHLKELSVQAKPTFQDVEAVAEFCKNKIMEDRLWEDVNNRRADNPTAATDVMATIDKLKKRNKDLSESLATNRNMRIDPRQNSNFTVLDLIAEYERKGSEEVRKKLEEFKKAEAEEVEDNSYSTSVDKMITTVVD